MSMNFNTIFTCFTVHVHKYKMHMQTVFFSNSALTRLLCLCKGGSRGWELASIS